MAHLRVQMALIKNLSVNAANVTANVEDVNHVEDGARTRCRTLYCCSFILVPIVYKRATLYYYVCECAHPLFVSVVGQS